MGMQIFDRIFNRDHVVVLGLVNDVDDRSQRRALARSRRAGDQNQAVTKFSNLSELGRQHERGERGNVRWDDAHDD